MLALLATTMPVVELPPTVLVAEDSPRAWEDIPGVALVGIVIGVVLLIAAIRAFTRRDR